MICIVLPVFPIFSFRQQLVRDCAPTDSISDQETQAISPRVYNLIIFIAGSRNQIPGRSITWPNSRVNLQNIVSQNISGISLCSFTFPHIRPTVVTQEEQNHLVLGSAAHTFVGCIRDMRLTSLNTVRTIRFPSSVPGLLTGVCHTSTVW